MSLPKAIIKKLGYDPLKNLDYERQVEQVQEERATQVEIQKNTRLTRFALWVGVGAMLAQAIQTIHDFYK